jgi:hypothetical protein
LAASRTRQAMPQAEGPCSAAKYQRAVLFVIGDQVDAALPPQVHVLGAVLRDAGEAHRFEHRFQHALFRRAELDEFEAVKALLPGTPVVAGRRAGQGGGPVDGRSDCQ